MQPLSARRYVADLLVCVCVWLVQILEMKVQKLEQLVRLKDGKIQTLVAKLRSQKPQS